MISDASPASAQVSITDRTIVEQGAGYDIHFAYPQIGAPSADAAMQDCVQACLDGFKRVVSQRDPREPPYSAQLTYAAARNDESVVSILFAYSVYTAGAHPNSAQTAFNFLLPDGARVFLPDLIGNDGIRRVSDLAIGDLTPRLAGPNAMSDTTWIQSGAGPYADNFETFELLPDELVLDFDPYAAAAYAAGPRRCTFHSRNCRTCCARIRGHPCRRSTAPTRAPTSSARSVLIWPLPSSITVLPRPSARGCASKRRATSHQRQSAAASVAR